MEKLILYRYQRADGGTTVSLNKPKCDYTTLLRLVADEGYELTNGIERQSCIDVESEQGWYEVPEIIIIEGEIENG